MVSGKRREEELRRVMCVGGSEERCEARQARLLSSAPSDVAAAQVKSSQNKSTHHLRAKQRQLRAWRADPTSVHATSAHATSAQSSADGRRGWRGGWRR
jgi:hypothetical protein